MNSPMNSIDQKWLDAIRPYWGGGTVPFWSSQSGEVDADKTIDRMMKSRSQKKLDPKTGAEIEWEFDGV